MQEKVQNIIVDVLHYTKLVFRFRHLILCQNMTTLSQDPLTSPAKRVWPSIDVGTEIYIGEDTEEAEWTVSDFDVLIQPRES